jgi:hypothetical protein
VVDIHAGTSDLRNLHKSEATSAESRARKGSFGQLARELPYLRHAPGIRPPTSACAFTGARWRATSTVEIQELRLAALGPGFAAFETVRMEGRDSMGLAHDGDRLFKPLPLTRPGCIRGCLHRSRRIARDLLGDLQRHAHEIRL